MSSAAISSAPWREPEMQDQFDQTPAADLGRFACGDCAENRDAGERAAAQLARANALLRLIRRADPKPIRSEGLEDDQTAQALLGFVAGLAVIKARIDLYFQEAGAGR
jgi:hypothetical protein